MLHKSGADLQTRPSTANPLLAAAHGHHAETVAYLLEAGIDPSITYEVADGVSYDAVCFALEQGARKVASMIALQVTGDDRIAAQAHLDQSWELVKRANRSDAETPIPPPPQLE